MSMVEDVVRWLMSSMKATRCPGAWYTLGSSSPSCFCWHLLPCPCSMFVLRSKRHAAEPYPTPRHKGVDIEEAYTLMFVCVSTTWSPYRTLFCFKGNN